MSLGGRNKMTQRQRKKEFKKLCRRANIDPSIYMAKGGRLYKSTYFNIKTILRIKKMAQDACHSKVYQFGDVEVITSTSIAKLPGGQYE